MRKLPQVRYINPASVHIGDTIRCTWKVKDVEHSRTGTVAKRDYEGGMRVLTTAAGEEIIRWHPHYVKQVKVTLIAEAAVASAQTLFDDVG